MIRKHPRAISLDLLNKMERSDRHPDHLLNNSFKQYQHLTPLDRAFLTELTYGVLRWRNKLDWMIRHFSKIPFEKIEPEIINILRLGFYQLVYLTKTPTSAAVNEAVELAKKSRGKGGGGFVNAILRAALREMEGLPYPDPHRDLALHVAVLQSHPMWLVQRWIKELGVEETLRICAANNRIPALTLRTNTLKIKRADLLEALKEKGLNPTPTLFSDEGVLLKEGPPVSELPLMKGGLFTIQDEASQLVTTLLDPKPGEKVLDACAAPGGKTTHIAQKMQNQGEIYAFDLHQKKLRLIEEGCRRLGIKIVKTRVGDAGHSLAVPGGMAFDRVLADVPCSGFGTLRRNPDLKWRRDEKDIGRLSQLQCSILKNLSEYVREEGLLVYSTCTVFHEENEGVVERFLAEHREFELDPSVEVLPENGRLLMKKGYLKTFPPPDEMDGFFVARLKKKS